MAVGQESPARDASATLRQLSKDVRDLGRRAERDRLLALRTRGIGVLTGQRALDAGLSGPNLRASQSGSGDVSARLLERLLRASHELASAASGLAILPPLGPPVMMPDQVPTGSAESYVEGPRGSLSFTVESDGGPHPTRVSWSRPSASALALVPELLRDCEIPDALLVLASLDLSTAEADG
jgi:NADH-quinone oxidoreductase subunit D